MRPAVSAKPVSAQRILGATPCRGRAVQVPETHAATAAGELSSVSVEDGSDWFRSTSLSLREPPVSQRFDPPPAFRPFLLALVLALTVGTPHASDAGSGALSVAVRSIRVPDLKAHEQFLASDELEGREAGTVGGWKAAEYLVERLRRLKLQPAGVDGGYLQPFGNAFRNVLALVPGRGDERGEYVVVGAHYDHVGYGTPRNSRGPIGHVHNGADDNASGVSAVLEVAEAFHLLGLQPRRSVLFAFWDAEEKGLLGSEYWLSYPTVPADRVRLYVNVDMVGRMRNHTLTVYGTRTAAGLRRFVCEQNRGTGLRLQFPWDLRRDGDHYSFYLRAIPELMLHTGRHDDYHRPTDDVERINFDGLQQTSRLLLRLVWAAANARQLPDFRWQSYQEDSALQAQVEVPLDWQPNRLGAQWRRTSDGDVEVTAVPPGSPADQAGLLPGDHILRFGGLLVREYERFRPLVLAAENPVSIEVRRPGREKPVRLQVHLQGDPLRVGISWRVDDAEPRCVILTQVVRDSPADLAGLRPNDRVYLVNGKPFANGDEFLRLVNDSERSVRLLIERDGQVRPVRVRLVPELRMRPNST